MSLLILEWRREWAKFKRSLFGAVVGTVFMVLVYRLLGFSQAFGFLGTAGAPAVHTIAGGAWTFLAWAFCIATSTQLARDLVDDTTKGTLVRLQQSPAGIVPILVARFLAVALASIISLVPLAVAVKLLFHAAFDITGLGAGTLAVFALQCLSLSLLLCATVFVARSERAAHLAVFILGYSAALIPVGSFAGSMAWAVPWSGMLALSRQPSIHVQDLVGGALVGGVLAVISAWLVRLSLGRLRHNGVLSHR